MPTEEERATAFRAQAEARYQARQAQAAAMTGDPVAAAAVRAAWSPLLPAATDTWDAPPEIEPGRPRWLGRIPAGIELPEYLK
jgi:hypothetical protein